MGRNPLFRIVLYRYFVLAVCIAHALGFGVLEKEQELSLGTEDWWSNAMSEASTSGESLGQKVSSSLDWGSIHENVIKIACEVECENRRLRVQRRECKACCRDGVDPGY